jgi:hypothetical protein
VWAHEFWEPAAVKTVWVTTASRQGMRFFEGLNTRPAAGTRTLMDLKKLKTQHGMAPGAQPAWKAGEHFGD